MNTKKFIGWQLKKWIPLIIVSAVALMAIFSIACLSTRTWHRVNTLNNYNGEYGSPMAGIFYPGFVFTFIMAWAAQNYRFKKTASDAYRQFPTNNRKIKNIKFLLGFAVLTIGFTIAYLFGVTIFGLRLASTPLEQCDGSLCDVRNSYHTIWFVLEYLFMLVVYFLQYSFNSFLISLCGTKNAALVTLFTGNWIMFLALVAPAWVFTNSNIVSSCGGIFNFAYMFHSIPDSMLISGTTNLNSPSLSRTLFVLASSLNVIVCTLSAVFFLKGKEPSGEYFGAPASRFKSTAYIIDASLFFSLIALAAMLARGFSAHRYMPYLYLLAIPGFALHYAAFALFNKTSKLTSKDIIVMIFALAAFIFASVVAAMLS